MTAATNRRGCSPSTTGWRPAWRKAWALGVLLLGVLLAGSAWAGGTFKLRTPTVQEVSGGWHIYCEIALPKAPPIAHPTIRFVFTKTMVYERDLVDTSPNPVVNRTALQNQNPSVEALEVDFADAKGDIYPRTRFDFSLTRTRGYEAGEYKLQVRTTDGTDIGAPATVILNGDNPVVDRRAMNFDTKNPGMKKIASLVDAGTAPKIDDTVAAAPLNGDVAPAGSAPPFLSKDAFQKQPEEMADHPKGCGCGVAGLPGRSVWGLLAGSALAMLLVSRRRRRS
jgi:hypothetical protein